MERQVIDCNMSQHPARTSQIWLMRGFYQTSMIPMHFLTNLFSCEEASWKWNQGFKI